LQFLIGNARIIYQAFQPFCSLQHFVKHLSPAVKDTMLAFSALTLLVKWQKGIRPEKNEWWGAGAVICLERGADLHMAQLMPLLLTVSCFSKIQIGLPF